MISVKNLLFTKKRIALLIALIAALAVIIWWKNIAVFALSVIDSFNDTSKIAATWNISTSTPGEIKLATRSCDVFNWFCSASTTCANYLGDGDYIIVAQNDASTTLQWKTANTACSRPYCGADGGQNGDNLVADNTVSFGAIYPARNYCKSIGGRLPTIDELSCMYTNRASFGDNFEAGYYWSSTEASATAAWNYYWPGAYPNDSGKTFDGYVRCVKGW